MNLNSLSNVPGAKKAPRRVGRGEGSGSGKTCGRGNKGQMARAGAKRRIGFEGGQMRLIRRVPKRGFNHPRERIWVIVNIADLCCFPDGSEVGILALREFGLVCGCADLAVKILGDGELDRKLTIEAHAFSASAKAKIEAAGGKFIIIA